MNPVTDPAILAQLNGPTPVTDPSLLAQLNGDGSQTTLGQDAATVAREGTQGLTMGWGGTATSGIDAALLKAYDKMSGDGLFNGKSIGDIYNQGQAIDSKDMADDRQNSPWLSAGSNLAGGALTTAASMGLLADAAAPSATAAIMGQEGPMSAKIASYLTNSPTKLGQTLVNTGLGATQGAVYGAGSADTTNGQSRLGNAGNGAILGGILGGTLGSLGPKQVNNSTASLGDALVNGTENSKQEIGSQLGQKILDAGTNAKNAKSDAYDLANAVGDHAIVQSPDVHNLANAVDSALDSSQLDPSLSPAVKVVKSATQSLRNDASGEGVTGVSYNRIESLRKKINAIPYTPENAVAKSVAKQALDNHMQGLFENGQVSGGDNVGSLLKIAFPENQVTLNDAIQSGKTGPNSTVLDLIQDARAKNATWQNNFKGKNANPIIKKYVATDGDSLTPENLVDRLTSPTQQGYSALTATKGIAPDAEQALKDAMITKMRSTAVDGNGNLNPVKLAKGIQKVANNQSSAESVFNPQEIQSLQDTANAGLNIKGPGLAKKLAVGIGSHVPIPGVPTLVKSIASNSAKNAMIKQLLNAGKQTNYPTLFGIGQ